MTNRINHRVLDVGKIAENLQQEGITHVFSIEAICEFSDFEKFIVDCYELLPPGGRLSVCDQVRIRSTGVGPIKRAAGGLLIFVTSIVYGDNWRQMDSYKQCLERTGFIEVGNESIGAFVFPQLAEFAEERYHLLEEEKISLFFRLFAYLNLRGLGALFKWQQIDYRLLYGQKPIDAELDCVQSDGSVSIKTT